MSFQRIKALNIPIFQNVTVEKFILSRLTWKLDRRLAITCIHVFETLITCGLKEE